MQSGGGQELAGTLANLDAMFGEDRLWNRVKNYVVTWQLFTEYMIEYSHIIDGNDCNIPTFDFVFQLFKLFRNKNAVKYPDEIFFIISRVCQS